MTQPLKCLAKNSGLLVKHHLQIISKSADALGSHCHESAAPPGYTLIEELEEPLPPQCLPHPHSCSRNGEERQWRKTGASGGDFLMQGRAIGPWP